MAYWNADHIFSVAIKAAGLEEKDDDRGDVIQIYSMRRLFFSLLVPVIGTEVVFFLWRQRTQEVGSIAIDAMQAYSGACCRPAATDMTMGVLGRAAGGNLLSPNLKPQTCVIGEPSPS